MRRVAAILPAVMLMAAAAPPGWLYPGGGATPPAGGWSTVPLELAGSTLTFSEAQLRDLQVAVDWFPDRHAAMPAAVARGPAPGVGACAFCHLPGGEGRPENASLAGLPEDYLVAQAMAFRGGERHGAVAGWVPSDGMAKAAKQASDADLRVAAQYFSRERFVSRVKVVETATVPRTMATGFMLVPLGDGRREPIGGRIIEVADDVERFERRDPRAEFTAYVPPGSVARGAAVAKRAGCVACHSAILGGWGPGRSPSYIVRQLHGFAAGARGGAAAAPMQAVVAQLSDGEMVDVAAWYAARRPT